MQNTVEQIGNAKLICGDCLEVMKAIPDGVVDMILCDLPYGTTACKWDTVIPFEPLWEQYKRVIKPNGAIVLFGQTPFDKVLGCSNLEWLRYEWIWRKHQGTNPMMAKKAPMKCHENILVFYNKQPTYNPQMWYSTPYNGFSGDKKLGEVYGDATKSLHRDNPEGSRYPLSVQEFTGSKIGSHPTQKPVALCEYLIRTYTNEGEIVLDNTMGSGTTGVACANTGRRFIGIEQDAKYYEIAKQRIANVGNT